MKGIIATFLGLLLGICLHVGNASAFVVDWEYSLDYGFTSWTVDEGSFFAEPIQTSDPVTLDGVSGYRQLTWGDPVNDNQRSSIWFERKTGNVQTNGPIVDVNNMFHANYPIYSDSDILTGGVVRSVLTLSPTGTTDQESFTASFDFFFWETLNDGTYEDDIFLVGSIAQAEFSFLYEGTDYMVSFLPSFEEVSAANLADNGIDWPGPAYGWTTVENLTNQENTMFMVTAAPVPEPSTFLAFAVGGGLLMFFVRKRRLQ